MPALLEGRGLTVRFGGLTALKSVDLAVSPGEVLSVIGPNGAGKTTLFNVITGRVRPTQGSVAFRGEPIHRLAQNFLGRFLRSPISDQLVNPPVPFRPERRLPSRRLIVRDPCREIFHRVVSAGSGPAHGKV